jgi:endonuclease G
VEATLRLSVAQFQSLYEALNDAITDLERLQLCARLGTGQPLEHVVNVNQPLPGMIQALIQRSEARDQVTQLVAAARVANPTSQLLQALADGFALPPATVREAIQQLGGRITDIGGWIRQVGRIMRSVGRLDVGEGPARKAGTAFLVGSQAVLTNHHVMKPLAPAGAAPLDAVPGRDRVTFDHFLSLETGLPMAPVVAPLHNPWHGASSPESDLDFALVHVEPPAAEPADARAPLPPGARLPQEGDSIVVLGHPNGDWLTWSFGHITRIDRANGIFQHNANTDFGSSGSPVFTSDLQLIGLHWGSRPGGNCASLLRSVLANLPGGHFPD